MAEWLGNGVPPMTPDQWLRVHRDEDGLGIGGTVEDNGTVEDGGTVTSTGGRYFTSGAYRDTDDGKLDYEGFLSPAVLERYAQYMDKHRRQSDGVVRDSDNWQAGIPRNEYMKSGLRHVFDWWKAHRGLSCRDGIEDALCGVLFNACGYLHELLKEQRRGTTDG